MNLYSTLSFDLVPLSPELKLHLSPHLHRLLVELLSSVPGGLL